MAGHVIGFTNKYYTLWYLSAPYKEYISPTSYYIKQDAFFERNLSYDLDKAKEKAYVVDKNYMINLELRGTKARYGYTQSNKKTDLPANVFPYGKLVGQEITTCDDIWQLKRIFEDRDFSRSRVYARRRLLELGVLVRHRHVVKIERNILWGTGKRRLEWIPFNEKGQYDYDRTEITWGNYDIEKQKEVFIKDGIDAYEYYEGLGGHFFTSQDYVVEGGKYVNYILAEDLQRIKEKEEKSKIKNGYWFNQGEKIELELTLSEEYGFDTQWGYTTIQKFIDQDYREFIYMGSSPKDFTLGEVTKISATIKHQEYNMEPQTKLLRIKKLKK